MTYDHHSTQVEYNGTTYYGHNAVITSTQLGHSHNLPTLSIHTKWGGGGGGIGPLILADYDSDSLTIRPFSFGIALDGDPEGGGGGELGRTSRQECGSAL